jgi:hypothetical protein
MTDDLKALRDFASAAAGPLRQALNNAADEIERLRATDESSRKAIDLLASTMSNIHDYVFKPNPWLTKGGRLARIADEMKRYAELANT